MSAIYAKVGGVLVPMGGPPGATGPAGAMGATGATGAAGAAGATGAAGPGVPTGGTAAQLLRKVDSTNYNLEYFTADYVHGSGVAKITVGTSTPGSPSVGDVWVDTN